MKTERNEKRLLFLAGSLIGLLVFFLIYGASPLNPANDAFLRGGYVEQDIRQHYAGWLYYRNAPLTVPFCNSPQLNWPQGMSVAFTDSIPLFAVLFRLLVPILPGTFQYFGLFTLLCFMLQGGFAALLLRLFTSSRVQILFGVLPFTFSPILLERAFRHTSLASHFLVLAALYYYIKGRREGRLCGGLFLINCLSVTIHPYFVPMTLAVTFALVLELSLQNRRIQPFGWLLANLAACGALGWLFGIFSSTGSGSGGSGIQYGHFSMNLNALWNPTSRGVVWSRFLPVQNQLPGNYDGFAYLGLGMLLLIACSAVFFVWDERKHIFGLLSRHGGLLFVCVCLFLFAITHIVTANGATLLRIPLPQVIIRLATTLRSSGRMFWPIYYLLFVFALRGIFRLGERFKKRGLCAALIVLTCLVQLADISPALLQKSKSMRSYQAQIPDPVTGSTPNLCDTSDFFEAVRGKYDQLIALDSLTHTGVSLLLYTADEGMSTTDTSALARYNEELALQNRDNFFTELAAGTLRSSALYVTEREETFLTFADIASKAGAWCAALQTDFGSGNETVLYVIAPNFDGSGLQKALPFGPDFPIHLPDHSDDYWDHGVLSLNLDQIGREADKDKVIGFYDTPFLREKLAGAAALCADGIDCPILEMDDRDPGWIMLRLDIPDAHILIEKDLTFKK